MAGLVKDRGHAKQHPEVVTVLRIRCNWCDGYGGEITELPTQEHGNWLEKFWEPCRFCNGLGYEENVKP